jgi:hypothetical protein
LKKSSTVKTKSSTTFRKNFFFIKKPQAFQTHILNNLVNKSDYTSLFPKLTNISPNHYNILSDINSSSSLKKNTIFKLNTNTTPILTKTFINNSLTVDTKLTTTPTSLLKFVSFFLHFIYEKKFVYNTNRKLSFVLSKIPFYKMDPISSVTADKNRGNIYKKLSLINLKKINKNHTLKTINSINYNSNFTSFVSLISTQSLIPNTLNWSNQINKLNSSRKCYTINKKTNSNYNISQNFTFLKMLIFSKSKNKIKQSIFFNLEI